jgi:hypothetical protein
MNLPRLRCRQLILVAIVCLTFPSSVFASDELALTKDQITHFLLTAKVVKSHRSNEGITNLSRLTLTDGTVTHDASFQAVDEHKARMETIRGIELAFVDSYNYNIAAYRLGELLGIDDMMPIYVERRWGGNPGSLSWWLPMKMDEVERHKQNLRSPDPDAWNKQMYKVRVFDELVYDTDANLTDVLIGEDWKIWTVDFTRVCRLSKDLRDPKDSERCDRRLLESSRP